MNKQEPPTLKELFDSANNKIAEVEDESTRHALYEILWAVEALARLL